MNDPANRRFETLHAILQEVEPGLFGGDHRGEMNQDQTRIETFPDRHIGTSADRVKQWVEAMAARLGYRHVRWDAIETG